MKKSFLNLNMPTFLGVGILIVGLMAGIFFIGNGTGAFVPRASPQTTPKLIKVTNVTDGGFAVSFVTDEATVGFIKYGVNPDKLESQATDERDQLSGSAGQYTTHHILAKYLQADTPYYFTIGTSSNSRFDNNGTPFTIKTTKKLAGAGPSKTAYGTVKTSSSLPAEGAIIYLSYPGAGDLSTYVKSSGSWSISLSNFINDETGKRVELPADDQIYVFLQGLTAEISSTATIKVANITTAQALTFGQDNSQAAEAAVSDESSADTSPAPAASGVPHSIFEPTAGSGADGNSGVGGVGGESTLTSLLTSPSPTATDSSLTASPSAAPIVTTVNTTVEDPQVVNTTQPLITGQAPPNTKITIEIHSDEAITTQTTTNADGGFEVSLESLKKTLAPGEHTITITYTDPRTGQPVTEQRTFTVETQLAAITPSASPYGSGNPFKLTSPSPSLKMSPSATATSSGKVGMPSTSSARPVSGSVELTYVLVVSGFAFILLGIIVSLNSQRLVAYFSEVDE